MPDKITLLRSIAHTPDSPPIQEWERDQWEADVKALDRGEFDDLMAPLLENGRAGLQALPEWSRTYLFARWLLKS